MRGAVVGTGGTDVTTVEDETVVYVFPIFFLYERLAGLSDFLEIVVIGEIKPLCESFHMRIGRNSLPNTIELA